MITDSDRIDCIDKILSSQGYFDIKKRKDSPFNFECFSIETQWFYGDNIRDICDNIITGEYKDRNYYGKEWNRRMFDNAKGVSGNSTERL